MKTCPLKNASRLITCGLILVVAVVVFIADLHSPYEAHAANGVESAASDLVAARMSLQGDLSNSGRSSANYAVYSASDRSLTFLYSASTPTADTFGKPVTAVYDGNAANGWAVTDYTRVDLVPWWNYMREIASVEFRDVTRPIAVAYWFCQANAPAFTSIDCRNLDVSNVVDARCMFFNANQLQSIDMTGWNTENITSMASMFQRCSSLADIDISHFKTSNVTTFASMFAYCSQLTNLDIRHFDTSNAKDLGRMFDNCTGLESVNVSGINTAKAYLGYMFYNCPKIEYVDLSSFDTGKTTSLAGFFGNCTNLKTIVLGEEFDFFGKGTIRDKNLYGIFPTPPSDDGAHNGKWTTPTSKSYPQYTPEELRSAYSGSTMAGTYVWATPVTYPVSFNANGGAGSMDTVYVEPTGAYRVPTCDFFRTGYVFAGWNTKADGTGVAYWENESLTPNEPVELFAQWTEARMVIEVTDAARVVLAPDGSIASQETYAITLKNKGNVDVRVSGMRYVPAVGTTVTADPIIVGDYDLWMKPKGGTLVKMSDYASADFAEPANPREWAIASGATLRLTGVGGMTAGMNIYSSAPRVSLGQVMWRFSVAD